MSDNEILQVECPVCGMIVNARTQRSLVPDENRSTWFCSFEDILDIIKEKDGHDPHSDRSIIHWACNKCLDSELALIGDPTKQKHCDCYPYYAFFDETRQCEKCGETYVFHKEEQKHWYETLRFWVQSRPKKCKSCYKIQKQQNVAQPTKKLKPPAEL